MYFIRDDGKLQVATKSVDLRATALNAYIYCMSQTIIAVHFIVFGHVQGVGFRSWTASQARHFNIKGWVRNNSDDSVELVAEGTSEAISQFTALLHSGNSYSSVEHITQNRIEVSSYRSFDIIY